VAAALPQLLKGFGELALTQWYEIILMHQLLVIREDKVCKINHDAGVGIALIDIQVDCAD
jgi:hypothetical protein